MIRFKKRKKKKYRLVHLCIQQKKLHDYQYVSILIKGLFIFGGLQTSAASLQSNA